jgi:phospholipase C
MNAKTKLRGLYLAAVIAAVPLAFTAVLPSAQQAPELGASLHQSDRGSSARSASHGVRAAASRSAFPIQHVVVVYLENHSFDSVLGFWCDNDPGRCPDGGMPSSVTLSNGVLVSPSTSPDTVPNVTHNVASEAAAIDGGRMDGWQNIRSGTCGAATGYQCISGYQSSQVPNVVGLAQSFAISDQTFSVADSPSWAGHMAIAAASQDHFYGDNPHGGSFKPPGWGCDSGFTTPWIAPNGKILKVPSCVPDPSLNPQQYPNGGAFEPTPVSYIPTIMDRLDAAGLSWKIYGAIKGAKGYGIWDICPTFAECLDTSQDKKLVPDAKFLTDAAAGKLPAFSVVTPGGADFLNAGHNGMSMTRSDNWAGQLVSAVMNSPDWSSTAVFVTWDDFGGFYDQVPPPVEPDGTQEGVRVPMIIVSPYARPGYTDTAPTTFAGVLSYTEHDFGLPALGVNDAQAYDFANAFNYDQPPLKPIRMVTRPLPASAKRIQVTPALEHDPT